MAITYNGTAITSATYDGTTYKYISYNGCVAYACARVCNYTLLSPDSAFCGFERKMCGDCYYLRAKFGMCPYACGVTRIYWAGGNALANCCDDLLLSAHAYHHMGCTCIIYCACGSVCGQTYRFPVVQSPTSLSDGLCMYINSDDCQCLSCCINWRSGCTSDCYLYSDWVRVCCCDYMFGTICYKGQCIVCYPSIYLSTIRYCYEKPSGVSYYSDRQFQDTTGTCITGITTWEVC